MSEQTYCLPVAAVILAAGSATRMGKLKQLLPFEDKTLVEHAVAQAAAASLAPIIVVVGSESQAVRNTLAARAVAIVDNTRWQSGMGSSIAAGVRHLQELATDSAAVAILVADQPLVTATHLHAMRKELTRSGAAIIAAHYNGTLGVPAIFKRSLFPMLASLEPEAGARFLLRDPNRSVLPFELPEAALDVDTPEDFAALSG